MSHLRPWWRHSDPFRFLLLFHGVVRRFSSTRFLFAFHLKSQHTSARISFVAHQLSSGAQESKSQAQSGLEANCLFTDLTGSRETEVPTRKRRPEGSSICTSVTGSRPLRSDLRSAQTHMHEMEVSYSEAREFAVFSASEVLQSKMDKLLASPAPRTPPSRTEPVRPPVSPVQLEPSVQELRARVARLRQLLSVVVDENIKAHMQQQLQQAVSTLSGQPLHEWLKNEEDKVVAEEGRVVRNQQSVARTQLGLEAAGAMLLAARATMRGSRTLRTPVHLQRFRSLLRHTTLRHFRTVCWLPCLPYTNRRQPRMIR